MRPRASNTGAGVRNLMRRSALNGGLSGLGSACDSTEAQITRAILGGAGIVTGAVAEASSEPIYSSKGDLIGYTSPHEGYTTSSSLLTAASSAWGAACTQPQSAETTSAADIEARLAAEREANRRAILDAQASQNAALQSLATAMASQRQPTGPDTKTILLYGGLGLAALVAIGLVLK